MMVFSLEIFPYFVHTFSDIYTRKYPELPVEQYNIPLTVNLLSTPFL